MQDEPEGGSGGEVVGVGPGSMTINMDDARITTLEQVRTVLENSEGIVFKGVGREQRYR